MAKAPRTPSYRLHKSTGRAVVTIAGREHYLGKHDTPESHARYHELLANHFAGRLAKPEGVTIAEVVQCYRRHAATYYRRDGKPTSEVASIRCAVQHALDLYGSARADTFDVIALRAVRDAMIDAGHCRSVVNQNVGRVVRCFRWAATEKLYSAELLAELMALPGLRRGRSRAHETKPVEPVSDKVVDATLPHLPPVVADMVRLQRVTGMRPGEVVIVRPCDVDRNGIRLASPDPAGWICRPIGRLTA